ncbi:MAG TPA: TIGR02757 family protein [Flavisolibacter sp.]|nr:TIGR02757 family protein [Flavisolibacter sp.]
MQPMEEGGGKEKLKEFLDRKVLEYNKPAFIEADPVCIPHRFTQRQDIEIAGFFAAIFAWGNRTIIINKSGELLKRMDNSPYQFIRHLDDTGRKALLSFKHRTFNTTDLLYFVDFLHFHYAKHDSLESAFSLWMDRHDPTIEKGLRGFHRYFFSIPDAPPRTKKHIATPDRNSTCKRLNMYLRWMVRKDRQGVDFGIWKEISPAQLVCPIDLHVARVAKRFGLINRNAVDWQTALELTEELRRFDASDPAKYDFSLFGLGVVEKFKELVKKPGSVLPGFL